MLESSHRLGGAIQSTKYKDGTVFDHGPRSFRPAGISGANTMSLATELGLEADIIGKIASDRYIFMDSTLHQLPNGVMSVFRKTPPFSKWLIRSLLRERFVSKGSGDESIHAFFERRFGKEVADYAADPLCRGVFAGDARKLSMKSTFPALYYNEQKYGTVAPLLKVKSKEEALAKRGSPELHYRSKYWAMWTLKNGCQQLVDAMEKEIRSSDSLEIHEGRPCTEITFQDNAALVYTGEHFIKADHVFSAVYSGDLADMLPTKHSKLAHELESIPSVSVIVVNLEFDVESPIKGFGHLLPSTEDGPILGVVYDSCAFPELNRQSASPVSRYTIMMGGSWYDELYSRLNGSLDPNSIADLALKTMKDHLRIEAEPSKMDVIVYKQCIPQYVIGHADRIQRISDYIQHNDLPLSLMGSSYRGVSVNDCIYNAKLEVEKLVSQQT